MAPELDVPERRSTSWSPRSLRRDEPARLPEVSEPEIVRHYVRLSTPQLPPRQGFYPLGSCTMKHNPKLHERVAALPGHARLHPLQDPERAQGALELMWRLQGALAEIAGLPHVSLQPSAGSHGELAGVLLTRAYHEDRGETRTQGPHARHRARHEPGDGDDGRLRGGQGRQEPDDGGVDLDDLRAKADDHVACLMLTNPNTLGLFDPNIEEIAAIVHDVGATLYYDGANLNAIVGMCAARRHGLRHRPLQPAQDVHPAPRRRRPGRGPDRRLRAHRALSCRARRSCAARRERRRAAFDLDYDRPKSIGRLRGFQGNYGTFVRSYAYICSLGAEGLQRDVRDGGAQRQLPAGQAQGERRRRAPAAGLRPLCMHEFVLSGAPMKRELGVKTLDLAKRLLDHGVHPPTVYFPLLVDEALLVEPTETETQETLDGFADAVAEILREAGEDPTSPRTRPTRRRCAASTRRGAAKRPVIRQPL